ncbi:asparaginase [Xylaria sp. CBS 124048]|nr:asparaginase [Xylaria sp. CBS 124048]
MMMILAAALVVLSGSGSSSSSLLTVAFTTAATAAGARNDNSPGLPMVINTWGGAFTAATDAAYIALREMNASALDAVEIGCNTCEANQCDGTVGYGGSPDENCETTLDAMIMDGDTMKSGSVAALRRVKSAISVARAVLEHTSHTMIAGDFATDFALGNGFIAEDLTTSTSAALCSAWKAEGCQPNYRLNVSPDPAVACGPYTPLPSSSPSRSPSRDPHNSASDSDSDSHLDDERHMSSVRGGQKKGHDTISQITLHPSGSLASGTSTNGASHKIPGRVGDGPITGSASYVDSAVGGCGATGDGDIMMRFLPCYQAVESLRLGMRPKQAAEDAVRRMLRKYPNLQSGVVVVDKNGAHGAAGSGWTFTYAYRGGEMDETVVVSVPPLHLGSLEL